MMYVIDRLENGIAICINQDKGKKQLKISLASIAGPVQEGAVIIPSGADLWKVDTEQTAILRAEIQDRFSRITGKHKDGTPES